MIKGVIFDFHGTLARSKREFRNIDVCKFLRKNGVDVYHQEYEAAYKHVFFLDFPKGNIKTLEEFARRIFEVLEINVSDELIRKYVNWFTKNKKYELFSDVKYIKDLPLKKAILTTIPRFRMTNLDLSWLDLIFTGVEIGRAKPHPNGFLKIAKIWNLKPREILMVGDEFEIDIYPAKKLGFKTLLIDREDRYPNYKNRITTLREIKKVLKKEM